MPVNPKSKNCVRDEMRRFKAGELHSGKGKAGKEGPVVTDKKQAIAIALSACGKSNYADSLQSLGFSQSAAEAVAALMSEAMWDKQFETGSTGNKTKRENKTTIAQGLPDMDIDSKPGKQKGSQGKVKPESQESLGPVALPKGNPQPGPRSLQLQGLRSFLEPTEGLTTGNECPPKKPRKPRLTPPKPQTMAQETALPKAEKPETEKVEKKRKKCTPANQANQTPGLTSGSSGMQGITT